MQPCARLQCHSDHYDSNVCSRLKYNHVTLHLICNSSQLSQHLHMWWPVRLGSHHHPSRHLRLCFDLHFNSAHWMDYFKSHTTSHSDKLGCGGNLSNLWYMVINKAFSHTVFHFIFTLYRRQRWYDSFSIRQAGNLKLREVI